MKLFSQFDSHTLQIHALLVMSWYNEKKMTDQSAEEKRWVFSSDLKEGNEDECLAETGREFSLHGCTVCVATARVTVCMNTHYCTVLVDTNCKCSTVSTKTCDSHSIRTHVHAA